MAQKMTPEEQRNISALLTVAYFSAQEGKAAATAQQVVKTWQEIGAQFSDMDIGAPVE